jgi:nucleoside-diphosphate-sugar epimerase
MKLTSVLFVGCGDLGSRAGGALLAKGWRVAGLCRHPERLPAGFEGIRGDYTAAGPLAAIASWQPDYVVATVTPAARTQEAYHQSFELGARKLIAGLGTHRTRAVIWVSSTRVYAESEGGWVDEAGALDLCDPLASAMIAGERAVLDSGRRGCVVRFAGLYGAADSRLLARLRRGELCPPSPVRYGNRIHREDAAGFLCHLLLQAEAGRELAPVYNGVDDLPAPQYEVESWLAAAMGVVPVAGSAPEPSAAPVDNTFVSANKRCSNHLLRNSGYRLRYPDYRSGYSALLPI